MAAVAVAAWAVGAAGMANEAVRVAHNIRKLTVAPLLGEAIQRISEERSVSSLFN